MAGVQVHPAGLLVETEHAGRADHCRWTTPEGGAVQLAAVDPLAARPFLQSPAGARDVADVGGEASLLMEHDLSLIHISEPTRLGMISYAVFCLKKKKKKKK